MKHGSSEPHTQGSASRPVRLIPSLCLAALLLGVTLTAGCELPPAPSPSPTATTGPTASPTASPTLSPSPTPSPTPSPSPSPSPTPTASPTPTPVPTPTPDPWAKFFSDQPVVEIKNPNTLKGTYLYKDKTLHVSIKVLKRNNNRENYVAEIYSRGPVFTNGYANAKKPRTTKMPWYIARTHKAVFAFNVDYWNQTTLTSGVKRTKGVILRNGKVISESKAGETLAIMPDGNLRIFEKGKVTSKQLLEMGVKDTIWFGPVLIKDGKVNPDMKKHITYKTLNKPNTRCSIGMVEPGHYFVVVSRNITLDQLAKIHLELGSRFAYNLDGGQSAAMVFMGNQVNEHVNYQRSLPELFFIGTSSKVPGVGAPVKGAKNTK